MDRQAGKGDTPRPVDRPNYDKNYQRMNGVCTGCPDYMGDDCAVSQHCRLNVCCNPKWGTNDDKEILPQNNGS